MKKTVLSLLLAILSLSMGSAEAVPAQKKTQISLGLNALVLSEAYSRDAKAVVGAGLRVDLNLGRWFSIAPEASAGIGGWSAGGTVNFRAKRFFAGAGYLAAGLGGSGYAWARVSTSPVKPCGGPSSAPARRPKPTASTVPSA